MASASRPYIAVIGGANVDIMARHDGLVLNDTDSNPGQMMLSAGGVARNVAENLARLGSDVELITSLGDDDFATKIKASLDLPHLDFKASQITPNTASDSYLSLHNAEGELLHAVHHTQLVSALTPSYLGQHGKLIAGASVLVADCNLPAETLAWLATFTPRPALFIDGVSAHKITRLAPILSQIDGLKCNQLEAATLLGLAQTTPPDQLARRISDKGVRSVILSLGAKGVLLARAGICTHYPQPTAPENILSVSGAGDALLAAYIHAIHHKLPQDAAIKMGLKAAVKTLEAPEAVHRDIAQIAE